MQLMKIPVVQEQLQKIHQQVYEGFISFEKIQACEPSSGLTTPWGEVYNNWFHGYLSINQQKAAEHVSKLSVAIARPEITGELG